MDGKKKKSKKKKGNSQNKLADDVPASSQEFVSAEQDNGPAPQLNHIPKVPSTTDVQSVGVSESDIELDRHKVYEERFVKLQEEVRQLHEEKNQWLEKETSLEDKMKRLQNDVDSCMENKLDLEEKLKNLQSGNDFFMEKEAILEERVKHVEGIKDSWILRETLFNEMASRVEEVNIRLQEEVKELKESRDGLLQENAQLRESITMMESRIQCIETEAFLSRNSPAMITETLLDKIPDYQPEAVPPPPLLEKREPENNELIEKVKEVQIESDQHSESTNHSTSPDLDRAKEPVESTISIDYAPEFGQNMYPSEETVQSLARTHNPFGIPNGMTMDNSRISEEIVSVPLDDIQVQEVEPQRAKEEDTSLPISDAPLIGAPFRLISFFAKYVSGADLVERDGGRSG